MSRGRPYDLLVFDWDGTLSDSLAMIVECMSRSATESGLPRPSPERVRATVGLGLEDILVALGLAEDPELAARVVERYRTLWRAEYKDSARLFEGTREALSGLEASGYRLAVATGKGRPGLDRDLERLGLEALFEATRTAHEARAKPDPEMVHSILAELDVPAGRALVIGDTTFDLEMARAAGVAAVGVASGGHPPAMLESAGALAILSDVTELGRWLGREKG